MTKEGRLATHLNCIKRNRPSPYAEEFKDHKEPEEPQEAIEEPAAEPKKKPKRGKK